MKIKEAIKIARRIVKDKDALITASIEFCQYNKNGKTKSECGIYVGGDTNNSWKGPNFSACITGIKNYLNNKKAKNEEDQEDK